MQEQQIQAEKEKIARELAEKHESGEFTQQILPKKPTYFVSGEQLDCVNALIQQAAPRKKIALTGTIKTVCFTYFACALLYVSIINDTSFSIFDFFLQFKIHTHSN